MQLKEIAMKTAFNILSQDSLINDEIIPVIFENEASTVSGYENDFYANVPKIYLQKTDSTPPKEGDIVYINGTKYSISSISCGGENFYVGMLAKESD